MARTSSCDIAINRRVCVPENPPKFREFGGGGVPGPKYWKGMNLSPAAPKNVRDRHDLPALQKPAAPDRPD
jgi:hypothetical protein